MKYAFSTNEENYAGEFDTIEAACNEAVSHVDYNGRFWVGEVTPPPQPETRFRFEDWIEQVDCQDEYCGDWAEGWLTSTREQDKELEDEVRAVMAAWLDRHDLRPQFFNVESPKKFTVEGSKEKFTILPA